MKRSTTIRTRAVYAFAVAAITAAFVASANAGNLLEDPGLELASSGGQTSNSAWVLDVNFPDGVEGAAQFQTSPWASNPNGTPGTGVWMKSYEGAQQAGDKAAAAVLRQDVPASAGVAYEIVAWYKREPEHLAGSTRLGVEFFDGTMLSLGSSWLELNGLHPADGSWLPFMHSAVAPPGTATVRVFVAMIDGVASDTNPQSAMFDDITLTPDESTPVQAASWGEIKGSYR